MVMAEVFISAGSNVDPLRNIPEALRRLGEVVKVVAASRFYRTPAVGPAGQPDFVNGMVKVHTGMPPRQLKFEVLRRIEWELGRRRTADRYAPRPIDLDIAVYGDLVINEADLKIPDPDIMTRGFLAITLRELAPEMIIPGTGLSAAQVAARWDDAAMEPVDAEFSRRLAECMRRAADSAGAAGAVSADTEDDNRDTVER